MKVLVACEFSGIVREAFATRGHEAVSCDLYPTELPCSETARHVRGDVRRLLDDDWDLMIAHPPCTHLSTSGRKYWAEKRKWNLQQDAVEFARLLLDAPIWRIALENPLSVLATTVRRSDQVIQPWMFGHGDKKTTCLWLKNLPPLKPTRVVSGRRDRIMEMSPSPTRKMDRSRTYPGIAAAMADQWGSFTAVKV